MVSTLTNRLTFKEKKCKWIFGGLFRLRSFRRVLDKLGDFALWSTKQAQQHRKEEKQGFC